LIDFSQADGSPLRQAPTFAEASEGKLELRSKNLEFGLIGGDDTAECRIIKCRAEQGWIPAPSTALRTGFAGMTILNRCLGRARHDKKSFDNARDEIYKGRV